MCNCRARCTAHALQQSRHDLVDGHWLGCMGSPGSVEHPGLLRAAWSGHSAPYPVSDSKGQHGRRGEAVYTPCAQLAAHKAATRRSVQPQPGQLQPECAQCNAHRGGSLAISPAAIPGQGLAQVHAGQEHQGSSTQALLQD